MLPKSAICMRRSSNPYWSGSEVGEVASVGRLS
jgi:hypothetical protein